MSSSLDGKIKVRKYTRQSITKLTEKLLKENREILDLFIATNTDESEINKEVEMVDQYEDKIFSTLTLLRTPVLENNGDYQATRQVGNISSDLHNFHTVPNKLKLPEVKLPKFGNEKDDNLDSFLLSFESIIGHHNLSQYEKFTYLKGQLRASPLSLIESLDVSEQTYDVARDLLRKAFASPVTRKFDTIRRLTQLKLQHGTDPYSFVGELRSITNQFNELKIDINSILQYFAWNALPNNFQTQLVQVCNCSKPSFAQIMDKIFEVIERIGQINDNKPKKRVESPSVIESNNFAVRVDSAQKKVSYCILCAHDSKPNQHHLRNCPVYPNPQQKVRKLNAMKSCTKCGYKNHSTVDCRFKFSSLCKQCNGQHMTFLCTNSNTTNSLQISDEVAAGDPCTSFSVVCDTSAGVSLTDADGSSLDSCIILPTFTCQVSSDSGKNLVRALRDTGSQRNYILESLAIKHNFPVVRESVTLNIHGFNSSRRLTTKAVAVRFSIEDKSYLVHSIVVPKINSRINVQNLDTVVDTFINKGYKLADGLLYAMLSGDQVIKDFGMIVGEDKNVLPFSYRSFGSDGGSAYIDTPHGVMLTGNLTRMIDNLELLPCCSGNSRVVGRVVPKPNVGKFDTDVVSFSITDSLQFEGDSDEPSDEVLDEACRQLLNEDQTPTESRESETNKRLISYVLDNTDRDNSGRLIMPIMWNARNCHLLAHNYNLARNILMSNLKKLTKNSDHLRMYHEVFVEQEKLGIIEKIHDIKSDVSTHPESSFLGHMGVVKMSNQSTKLRVVFLSNLCDKREPNSVSHNQCILPGPCLNHKITTSVMLLRFDEFLLLFDLVKAFGRLRSFKSKNCISRSDGERIESIN